MRSETGGHGEVFGYCVADRTTSAVAASALRKALAVRRSHVSVHSDRGGRFR